MTEAELAEIERGAERASDALYYVGAADFDALIAEVRRLRALAADARRLSAVVVRELAAPPQPAP